ncbi:hypothetical protein CYMTET_33065, partial [Cymbomonas tetramitiformis]
RCGGECCRARRSVEEASTHLFERWKRSPDMMDTRVGRGRSAQAAVDVAGDGTVAVDVGVVESGDMASLPLHLGFHGRLRVCPAAVMGSAAELLGDPRKGGGKIHLGSLGGFKEGAGARTVPWDDPVGGITHWCLSVGDCMESPTGVTLRGITPASGAKVPPWDLTAHRAEGGEGAEDDLAASAEAKPAEKKRSSWRFSPGTGPANPMGTAQAPPQDPGMPKVIQYAPTVVVDNMLLVGLEYELVGVPPPPDEMEMNVHVGRRPVNELGRVEARCSAPIAAADLQQELLLRVRLPNTEWSADTAVHSACGRKTAPLLELVTSEGRAISLRVSAQQRELGTLWISVWASYWIVNATTVSLEWQFMPRHYRGPPKMVGPSKQPTQRINTLPPGELFNRPPARRAMRWADGERLERWVRALPRSHGSRGRMEQSQKHSDGSLRLMERRRASPEQAVALAEEGVVDLMEASRRVTQLLEGAASTGGNRWGGCRARCG